MAQVWFIFAGWGDVCDHAVSIYEIRLFTLPAGSHCCMTTAHVTQTRPARVTGTETNSDTANYGRRRRMWFSSGVGGGLPWGECWLIADTVEQATAKDCWRISRMPYWHAAVSVRHRKFNSVMQVFWSEMKKETFFCETHHVFPWCNLEGNTVYAL